jgi:uncharacterized repeat protein (TIGR03803 family)
MGNLTMTADGSFVATTISGPFTPTANLAGSVFRVTPTTFETMFRFPASGDTGCPLGGAPTSSPVEDTDGSALYGANSGCGFANDPGTGTIYKLTRSATGWSGTLLHRFTGADGQNPANVTLGSDGSLYGVTAYGGPYNGTVFRITPSGILSDPPLHAFQCGDPDCTMFDPNDGGVPMGRSSNPSRPKETIIITATISPMPLGAGTPSGQVQLLDGRKKLGTMLLVNGRASFHVALSGMATHDLKAVYTGDRNFEGSTSVTLMQTVRR